MKPPLALLALASALVAAAAVLWAVSHGRREFLMSSASRDHTDLYGPGERMAEDEADAMCPHCLTPWRCNGHDEDVDVCSCGEVLVQPADPYPWEHYGSGQTSPDERRYRVWYSDNLGFTRPG